MTVLSGCRHQKRRDRAGAGGWRSAQSHVQEPLKTPPESDRAPELEEMEATEKHVKWYHKGAAIRETS